MPNEFCAVIDDGYLISQDTDCGGQRQMNREVRVLREVQGRVPNVVDVREIRLDPEPMLLMRKEQGTLSSMLKDTSNSNPRAIVK